MQNLLSLSVTPSCLKPVFTIEDIEDAVTSLLLFLNSSDNQQKSTIDFLHSVGITTCNLLSTTSDKSADDTCSGKTKDKLSR